MKLKPSIQLALCALLCCQSLAHAQDIDKELSDLAEKLATQVKEHNNKKITVLDFTDLEGVSSELGRYIAEELTVDLVMGKRGFAVLDRANLKSILAEHKLTASGLVNPDDAKKLGQFAGVDALILGTITPKDADFTLTAKIITTETAEVVGAAKAKFKSNKDIEKLLEHATTPGKGGGVVQEDTAKVVKSFGDLRVELRSLKIANNDVLMTMTLVNQNTRRSIWVAHNSDRQGLVKGRLSDSNGTEYNARTGELSGIPVGHPQQRGFSPATQIKPAESAFATVKFLSLNYQPATRGLYSIQLEFLLGHDFGTPTANVTAHNFVAKIETD
ncbi:MAG: FlgO family outer membrane protein [Limisphaerales bacterium]